MTSPKTTFANGVNPFLSAQEEPTFEKSMRSSERGNSKRVLAEFKKRPGGMTRAEIMEFCALEKKTAANVLDYLKKRGAVRAVRTPNGHLCWVCNE